MFGPLEHYRTGLRQSRYGGYANMSHFAPSIYDMSQAAMMAPQLGYWLPNQTQQATYGPQYSPMQGPRVGYAPRQNRPFRPTRGPAYIGHRTRGDIRYGKGRPSWR